MNSRKTDEPKILTANTYFWKPSGNASQRRSKEEMRLNEVQNWFESLGMKIVARDEHEVAAEKGELTAAFSYKESCKNVYKHLEVYRGDKKSNITALRKL